MTTVITVEQMHHGAHGKQHEAWCEWAKANNLDPTQISASYPIQVIDGQIHYRAMPRSLGGEIIVGADSNVTYDERTAPLIVPMPEAWPAP